MTSMTWHLQTRFAFCGSPAASHKIHCMASWRSTDFGSFRATRRCLIPGRAMTMGTISASQITPSLALSTWETTGRFSDHRELRSRTAPPTGSRPAPSDLGGCHLHQPEEQDRAGTPSRHDAPDLRECPRRSSVSRDRVGGQRPGHAAPPTPRPAQRFVEGHESRIEQSCVFVPETIFYSDMGGARGSTSKVSAPLLRQRGGLCSCLLPGGTILGAYSTRNHTGVAEVCPPVEPCARASLLVVDPRYASLSVLRPARQSLRLVRPRPGSGTGCRLPPLRRSGIHKSRQLYPESGSVEGFVRS